MTSNAEKNLKNNQQNNIKSAIVSKEKNQDNKKKPVRVSFSAIAAYTEVINVVVL